MYYHPELLQEDEEKLRQSFYHYNAKHDRNSNFLTLLGVGGYFGSVYYVSKFLKPSTVAVFSLAYIAAY